MPVNLRFNRLKRLDRGSWAAVTGMMLVAILTLWHGVVTLSASTATDLALRLDPYNARANALQAERALARSDVQTAVHAARRALVRSPAIPSAVRSLGLAASRSAKVGDALGAIRYAEALSRRDLGTNLWLIEFAIARNDVDSALHRYDIALRTSSGAAAVLFPVLARTLDDPEYVGPVTKLLQTKPPWARNFLEHIFNVRVAPLNIDRLAGVMARTIAPFEGDLQRELIERLVLSGQYDAAWQAYMRFRPQAARTQGSTSDPTLPGLHEATLFDWQYATTDTAIATPSLDGGPMTFRSFATEPVTLISQLLLLAPGSYTIAAPTRIATGQSAPYWTLTCVVDNRLLGSVTASASSAPTNLASTDATCPAQWLRFMMPESATALTEGSLDSVRLARVGPKELK